MGQITRIYWSAYLARGNVAEYFFEVVSEGVEDDAFHFPKGKDGHNKEILLFETTDN